MMRTLLEVTLIGAIFGLCGYLIMQIVEPPATCHQVLK